MAKQKFTFPQRLMHLITIHPWLKLIALFLAVLVWFYVRGEINRFNY
jgi:hypothetical protein